MSIFRFCFSTELFVPYSEVVNHFLRVFLFLVDEKQSLIFTCLSLMPNMCPVELLSTFSIHL